MPLSVNESNNILVLLHHDMYKLYNSEAKDRTNTLRHILSENITLCSRFKS